MCPQVLQFFADSCGLWLKHAAAAAAASKLCTLQLVLNKFVYIRNDFSVVTPSYLN
jgi:hypothetical protein